MGIISEVWHFSLLYTSGKGGTLNDDAPCLLASLVREHRLVQHRPELSGSGSLIVLMTLSLVLASCFLPLLTRNTFPHQATSR
jgi:hypothetical protein